MQIIITEIWDALIVIFLADFYFIFIYFSKWGATDLFI